MTAARPHARFATMMAGSLAACPLLHDCRFQAESSIHCPEMSFLSNHLTLRHSASGVVVRMEPRQALRQCAHDKNATVALPEKAPNSRPGAAGVHPGVASRHPSQPAGAGVPPARLQVSAASKWTTKSYEGLVEGGVKQVDFNFDWSVRERRCSAERHQAANAHAQNLSVLHAGPTRRRTRAICFRPRQSFLLLRPLPLPSTRSFPLLIVPFLHRRQSKWSCYSAPTPSSGTIV